MSNIYNSNVTITTENFTVQYKCDENGNVSHEGTIIGTYLQCSDGSGNIPFFIALKKNEVVNRNVDLIVYTGTYNGSTGSGIRLSADANNGVSFNITIQN